MPNSLCWERGPREGLCCSLGLIMLGLRPRAAKPLIVAAVLYACAAALPRPMAKIAVADPNVVVVDFHSHTNFSGDARKGFTPEENRAWHRGAGFNVAYVSDHRSFGGAESGLHGNPARVLHRSLRVGWEKLHFIRKLMLNR